MKKTRILQAGALCGAMVGFQAHGALLGINPPSTSPYYADFFTPGLDVFYNTANSGATGTFTAETFSVPNNGNIFTTGSTQAGNKVSSTFSGSFLLTASIAFNTHDNQYEVTSGTVTIDGALPGVTSGTGNLLLTANLKTGINSFGWGTKAQNEFDFLFTPTSGASSILADFFGTSGAGGIEVHEGTSTTYTDMTKSFINANAGNADTFVPEPAAYSLAGSVMALLGVALGRKKLAKI